jgi:DNA-binding PadR family transcriptional regulator
MVPVLEESPLTDYSGSDILFDMPRWSRANPLALAVLVCLYEKPMHPYEVAQTLRQRAKQESVRLNYGSLYAVVDTLEKRGFIKATGTLREGKRPERTVYEITDEGSREMNDWMTELIGVPAKEYPAFMAGLSFIPSLPPDEALMALRSRADALKVKLAGMRGAMKVARDGGLPRLFELEAEYEEQQLAAEVKFVNGLIHELHEGTLEGLEMWRMFHTDGFDPTEVDFNFEFPTE